MKIDLISVAMAGQVEKDEMGRLRLFLDTEAEVSVEAPIRVNHGL